jgi:hypothetical protein
METGAVTSKLDKDEASWEERLFVIKKETLLREKKKTKCIEHFL